MVDSYTLFVQMLGTNAGTISIASRDFSYGAFSSDGLHCQTYGVTVEFFCQRGFPGTFGNSTSLNQRYLESELPTTGRLPFETL